eukprot:TRINITY_DN256_c0_g1_i3.p1 TRINITY_DN256_c0_g1~~TRINITY_DN256_c0_g1_i3.p1  ORF type:complete len:421 (-),score=171.85 TRINITY_DN256_c0_g1_i3:267-1529(-)
MGSCERLCLRWNDFESNIKHGFSELRQEEDFFDVTLACGSQQIKAHKVILSACSPFFRSIIKSIPHAHPLLYLRGIQFAHLESLLCFMYNGEVNVTQEDLNNFLAVAEELKIKGLTQGGGNSGGPAGGEDVLDLKPDLNSPSLKRSRLSKASSSPGLLHAGNNGPRSVRKRALEELEEEDDDIQEVPPSSLASRLKSEPKDVSAVSASSSGPPGISSSSVSTGHHPPSSSSSSHPSSSASGPPGGGGGSTMVVTPDVALSHHEDLSEDPYAAEEDNYEDYGNYGSESGEMGNYSEAGLAPTAVAGPSGGGPADGNKGGRGGGGGIFSIEDLDREILKLTVHIGQSQYSCLECGHFSHQSSDLRKHIESRHLHFEMSCPICPQISYTRHQWQRHMRTNHPNKYKDFLKNNKLSSWLPIRHR